MPTDRSGRRKRHRRHKQGTAFHKMVRDLIGRLTKAGYVRVAGDSITEVWCVPAVARRPEQR